LEIHPQEIILANIEVTLSNINQIYISRNKLIHQEIRVGSRKE